MILLVPISMWTTYAIIGILVPWLAFAKRDHSTVARVLTAYILYLLAAFSVDPSVRLDVFKVLYWANAYFILTIPAILLYRYHPNRSSLIVDLFAIGSCFSAISLIGVVISLNQ